jgi:hypothetical protein
MFRAGLLLIIRRYFLYITMHGPQNKTKNTLLYLHAVVYPSLMMAL